MGLNKIGSVLAKSKSVYVILLIGVVCELLNCANRLTQSAINNSLAVHLGLYNSNDDNGSKHFKSSYNHPASILCNPLVLTDVILTKSDDYCMSFQIQKIMNWAS